MFLHTNLRILLSKIAIERLSSVFLRILKGCRGGALGCQHSGDSTIKKVGGGTAGPT